MSHGEPLEPGLYEDLVTSALEEMFARQLPEADLVDAARLGDAEAADRLAFHVAGIVEATIARLPEEHRAERGTELTRQLIRRLQELVPSDPLAAQEPAGAGRVLRAVRATGPDGVPRAPGQPLTPLLDTTLLSNAPGEPNLGKQLLSEIDSADRIEAIVAFIRFSGVRPLLPALRRHTDAGKPLRILTTTYTNSTEGRALDALVEAGADIRVSYDLGSTRLHAKAWLFHRWSGATTAYIGSSNLTHTAQSLGQEWNVRVSGRRNPALVAKVEAAFEGAWNNGDFVTYDAAEFARATASAPSGDPILLSPIEVRLEPFQERLLEEIEVSRERGFNRNLLVAATGTGKTVMAAVDYARVRTRLSRARLLFVAHRQEILQQSRAVFRHALRDPALGETWVAGTRPVQFEHVFASIQSLTVSGIEQIPPDHFDVVVVDEFHHAGAQSYQRLLEHLEPIQLLGLTATPERADGLPILHWFGDRIAADLRLWEAIDQQRLVPFQYYGIHDGLDLRSVPWRRGSGYDIDRLTNLYTSNDAWANVVITQVAAHVADPHTIRALGFCVSVAHARFMAAAFNRGGIRAVAVSGTSNDEERRGALNDLRDGLVQVVFSVDLFNEGVDLPTVDTIIMLRPTESATIFIQQLGRGLRRAPGKAVCTVLDFVGQHRREFRFDLRYRALLGGTRREVEDQVRNNFPFLPTGCHVELDPVAQDIVLNSLRNALPSRWPQFVTELRRLVGAGHEPRIATFLRETGLDLSDVYRNNRSWSELREAAGLPMAAAGPNEIALRRGIGRLLHLDDTERIAAFTRFADSVAPPRPQTHRDRALLRMLLVTLAGQVLDGRSQDEASALVWRHPQVLAELRELLQVLSEGIDHVHVALRQSDRPLLVHARYTRDEILAAMHQGPERAQVPTWREGVRWCADQQTDLFLVTLDKTPDHFSPTTMYRDYAISADLFHWESQSGTSTKSPTGRRYQEHVDSGSEVYLFTRQRNDERSFWFLGPATYVGHEGERPMAITWQLEHPLPGDLYAGFAASAVA